MKIITFGTMKGGTGKTTVVYNIGGILAEKHRVLFIDVDPQGNLSENCGVNTADLNGWTMCDVFQKPYTTQASDAITRQPMSQIPNIDIITGNFLLDETERLLSTRAGRERILQKWFERNRNVLSEYDYVLIDTNSTMSTINQNAFMVADRVVLVSDISIKSILGAQLFTAGWEKICRDLDREINTGALIVNNYDKRNNVSKEIKEYYEDDEEFKSLVLNTVIPARVSIKDTETSYLPINHTAPNSDACEAFRAVVVELKEREVF